MMSHVAMVDRRWQANVTDRRPLTPPLACGPSDTNDSPEGTQRRAASHGSDRSCSRDGSPGTQNEGDCHVETIEPTCRVRLGVTSVALATLLPGSAASVAELLVLLNDGVVLVAGGMTARRFALAH